MRADKPPFYARSRWCSSRQHAAKAAMPDGRAHPQPSCDCIAHHRLLSRLPLLLTFWGPLLDQHRVSARQIACCVARCAAVETGMQLHCCRVYLQGSTAGLMMCTGPFLPGGLESTNLNSARGHHA